MNRVAGIILFIVLIGCGCVHNEASSLSNIKYEREYAKDSVTLSDFSKKITGYYEAQQLTIPSDFDAKQFFDLLEKHYPDQSRVKHIRESYKVSVRPLDGGFYSVMLCDLRTDEKIMEDISCHLSRVEITSWKDKVGGSCVFESNWKPYCK